MRFKRLVFAVANPAVGRMGTGVNYRSVPEAASIEETGVFLTLAGAGLFG